jgi:hypothetical protein
MAKPMAPDPAIGIWTLNLSKSTFRLVPVPSVMTIEPWEEGIKVNADTPDAQGNKRQPDLVYKFEAQDYLLTDFPLADTISTKRITHLIAESVWKRDGKVVLTMRIVVSVDGKTLNVIRTRTDAEGRPIDDVLVYDKE